jgi:hypothetical protein
MALTLGNPATSASGLNAQSTLVIELVAPGADLQKRLHTLPSTEPPLRDPASLGSACSIPNLFPDGFNSDRRFGPRPDGLFYAGGSVITASTSPHKASELLLLMAGAANWRWNDEELHAMR